MLDRETVATAGETFVVDLAHPRDAPPSIDSISLRRTAVVESMANSLVSRLLAAPTANLRGTAERGDWTELRAPAAFDLDAEVTVPDSAIEDDRPAVDGPATDRGRPGEYASERLDD